MNQDDDDLITDKEIIYLQNIGERRELRHAYRDAIHDTSVNFSHDLNVLSVSQLSQRINSADRLYCKVTNTREGVLDSHLLRTVSYIGEEKVRSLTTNLLKFAPCLFAEKVITLITKTEYKIGVKLTKDFWKKIHYQLPQLLRRSPSISLVYGSLQQNPTQLRILPLKRKALESPSGAKVHIPKQLNSFSETAAIESTFEEVQKVFAVLKSAHKVMGTPICFFEFVVNRDSYACTIENIFYVSFLVREGKARIFLDDNKLPVIEPVENCEVTSIYGHDNRESHSNQFVLSLSKEEWKQIIETFHIEDSVLKSCQSLVQR